MGEDQPPATHYHYGQVGGFYVEFLSPLVGSEYDRRGKRKATREVGGVSSQQLRYIEILLVEPWKIALGKKHGYPFAGAKNVLMANLTSFLVQRDRSSAQIASPSKGGFAKCRATDIW